MIYKHTFGKVLKVKWPFTDWGEFKYRPALAVSDPNKFGDIEFLFITFQDKKISSGIIPISEKDFAKNPLPRESFLHLDKMILLTQSVCEKEVTEMTSVFMEMITRKIVKEKSKQYYKKNYKLVKQKHFIPGQTYIPASGKVLDEKELVNMLDASMDMWLTNGRFNDQFEKNWLNL